ncbi:MAG: hypothetical protein JRJ39_00450 [Deltaproteobacteria bacterium]|nr:hypothetical protein [Deltaproteobacteria bacterium]MBW1845578.1 hypothetical protein [Deltaproteobacteria bacterium]MBW2032007.1 hypothetical protein [Deltaproteobacteria bacterium]MBW2180967.1 hypothetical protein [Deltaproteobacteria bacterium]
MRKRYRTELRDALTQYEKDVDFFIPYAEIEAMKRVEALGVPGELRAGAGGGTYLHSFKTEFFHQAMNRMTKEAGLRNI